MRKLIVAAALCACTAAADCNSGLGNCVEEDTTSLVQTRSSLHHGSDRRKHHHNKTTNDFEKGIKGLAKYIGTQHRQQKHHAVDTLSLAQKACNVDLVFAHQVIYVLVVQGIGKAINWQTGDPNFMTTYTCNHREEDQECKARSEIACSGGCQWYPVEKVCKPLRIKPFVSYARASADSPFGLYTAAAESCNGRSKDNCLGDCKWDDKSTWASCTLSEESVKKTACEFPWQKLLHRVGECNELSEDECEKKGCELQNSNQCHVSTKEFAELGYGLSAGRRLYKQVKRMKDEAVEEMECGFGEKHSGEKWQESCKVLKKESATCRTSLANCGESQRCQLAGTQCELSTEYLREICPSADELEGGGIRTTLHSGLLCLLGLFTYFFA